MVVLLLCSTARLSVDESVKVKEAQLAALALPFGGAPTGSNRILF